MESPSCGLESHLYNSKNGGSNLITMSSRHLVHSLKLRIISTDQPQGNKQGDQHDIVEDKLRLDWGTSKYYGRRNYQMCEWAYRTTALSPTREIPLLLEFGSEAMTPLEIVLTSHRIGSFDPELGTRQVCRSLELIEKIKQLELQHTNTQDVSLIHLMGRAEQI